MPTRGAQVKVLVSIIGGVTINAALMGRLDRCKLRPKLKVGMSNEEAADAFESALKRYIRCLSGRVGS